MFLFPYVEEQGVDSFRDPQQVLVALGTYALAVLFAL